MEAKHTVVGKTYEIRDGRSIESERQELKAASSAASVRFMVGLGMATDGLNLRIAMPAVLDEDFAFRVQERAIVIFGTRRRPEGFGEVKKFALRYGDFQQRIPLPAGLQTQEVAAHLHHGVLDIHIPFAAVSSGTNATYPAPDKGT